MGYAITAVVRSGKDTTGLVKKYKEINDYYRSVTPNYSDATFLKNHDQNRIMSELGNDEAKARVAASILFTLPGTPYVYYGEEIGMRGVKPDETIREPFLWADGHEDPMQTTWEVPKYSTDQTVTPLQKQKDDPSSLYNFYKNWIAYRNANEILTLGELSTTPFHMDEVVSMIRAMGSEKLLALHNISDVEMTVSLDEVSEFKTVDFSTQEGLLISAGHITLPAHSSVVLKN
jgi:glycosidase